MLEIQEQIISYNKSSRNSKPIYIVVHDTGDPGAIAQNEHDYFSGGNRNASADFFVDSNNIIQIIDTDNYYSWHCGDGHGAYGISNANSLGIEMCLASDGQPTEATINNTIDLVKYLMNKYNIGIDNVVRHYDASRKSCPGSFMDNNWSKWYDFKGRVNNAYTGNWRQGWNQNLTGYWYCTDVTNKYYYKDCWQQIDGEWYSFDSDGYAIKSTWLQDSGYWYYLQDNCIMACNKWVWIDGECYYFGDKGGMYANCTTPDGYKVDETGAWIH